MGKLTNLNPSSEKASKFISGVQNYPANTWTSLGRFTNFSLGNQGAPAALVVAICFVKDTSFPYQQSNCAALLGPCWWVPSSYNGSGTRVPLESHTGPEFFINIRADIFQQGERGILINPESAISIPSTGRVDIQLLKLF